MQDIFMEVPVVAVFTAVGILGLALLLTAGIGYLREGHKRKK